jgi:hypothetical protein
MSLAAKKSETKLPMPSERTVLEERVDHIQRDVADLKQNVRRVEEKVDNVQRELSDFKTRVATELGEIKTAMKAMQVSMIRWMVGIMVSTILIAVTIAIGVAKLPH